MAAAAILPRGATLPTPRSPTLSDAGMILPVADSVPSLSPKFVERPPSPPRLLYSHSNRSAPTVRLGPAPTGRRGPATHIKSPHLGKYASTSNLRTMAATEARLSHRASEDMLGSSPIGAAISSPPAQQQQQQQQQWGGYPLEQRRSSVASSSVRSEDLENMKWPGFDGANDSVDDSGVVLEDEEQHKFPAGSPSDDIENSNWLDGQDGDDGDYSSAALSRRAEIILANAKKRLNVMEGNLRGARQSLVASPTSATFNTNKMASELSQQLSAARERDRLLYAGRGPIPPRVPRAYHSSPLSSNGSPGHSRGHSETAVPLPFSPTTMSRINAGNKRSSSAMGHASAPWSPEGYGQGRFPIREARSFEVQRGGWAQEDRDNSLRTYSRGSRSPPNTLETLPEDDAPRLHRSPSNTSDLRSQMSDLKGRISNLKQRAQEDNMRRRSLQSLRTPSPFTSAEIWYAGADAYKNGGSPVAADAGVGFKQESPTRKVLYEDESSGSSTPNLTQDETPLVKEESQKGTETDAEYLEESASSEYPESFYEDAEDLLINGVNTSELSEVEVGEETGLVSATNEQSEPGSVYEDAVYEMPVTERHEDRLDAFDYEHFFLHSAMGTYSNSRRSSTSSADSTETTRPVTAIHAREDSTNSVKRISLHQRNASVDSVSTVASFATAAEEQSSDEDDDDDGDQLFDFPPQILPGQSMVTPRPATQNRSDSAMNMKAGSSSQAANVTRGSSPASPSGDIAGGLRTSNLYTALLGTTLGAEPRLALNEEEKQLIYGLAASFQQVCANLQSTSGDQYERKEWRRRLDEARRVLNGDEPEGQPF